MSDENWKEPREENGITLGPEEALRKEIEKSKNLKLERLKLRDEIEKLRSENARLANGIEALKKETQKQPSIPDQQAPSPRWSFFLLIFNSCALGILLYFLFQK